MEHYDAAPPRTVRVIVADDEAHVVDYLCALLSCEPGFEVVGTAADANEAVELAARLLPDVALLDLRMPEGGGVSAAQLIGSISPETRTLIFSSAADEGAILPLLRSGIDGYLLKGCSSERIVEAITNVFGGRKDLAPELATVAIDALTTRLYSEQREELQRSRVHERIDRMCESRAFSIVCQPIVHLQTGSTRVVETLTRFEGFPTRSPHLWFEEAGEAGRRIDLELITAAAALDQLELLDRDVGLALNLSPATVLSGRLDEIFNLVPLSRITIELTEHALVENYDDLNAALAPLRERGLRVSVDDAGSGYASFAHILSISPDFIKLDISLTRAIDVDRDRRALANALVGFAQDMGVSIIAEGIETAAQLETLKELGAHYGQGYFLGRPVQLGDMRTLAYLPVAPCEFEASAEAEDRFIRVR